MRISDWSSDVCSSDLFNVLALVAVSLRIDLDRAHVIILAFEHDVGFERLAQFLFEFQRGELQQADRLQQDRKEHTSELQSLMRISYAVFCLKKKKIQVKKQTTNAIY